MTIKPLYDRVVVRRLAAETTTTSGIIIPDSAAEKPTRGEVIAVGEGTPADDGSVRTLSVKVGDRVLFGQYAGTEIELEGDKVVIMKEADILAVVVETEEQEKAA